MSNAAELRLRLWRMGFAPLPLEGKNPNVNGSGWQTKRQTTNEAEINLWSALYPLADNTGVLTRTTPFLDLDILDADAAAAAEQLIKERFDGHHILTRIGKWPKRAFPFQTMQPFKKIAVDLISPDGTHTAHEKIELLCEGQQCVVAGIHPDTRQPYAWHGGDLSSIHHDDLPGIDEDSGRALVEALAELVCREHGYRRKTAHKGNGADAAPRAGGADWAALFNNAADHDQLTASAAALIRAGLNDGSCVNLLRAAVDAATDADAARRARRHHEIPAMVASARTLIGHTAGAPPPKPARPPAPKLTLLYGWDATTPQPMGTVVKGLLHTGSITLIYGPPKSGKSFLLTDMFLAIAGRQDNWMGHRIVKGGPVLYVACEGHAGFWKRLTAAAVHYGWNAQTFPRDFVLATGRPSLISLNANGFVVVPNPDAVLNAIAAATAAGRKPLAVAVDTVFRSFGGGNVNASDHMNAYLAALATVTDQGAALGIIHHETKAGGTPAGSIVLEGSVDTIINTETLEDGNHSWQVKAAKDDATTDARKFCLKIIDVGSDAEGEDAASCVVVPAAGPVPVRHRKMNEKTEDFYKTFKDIMAEHGTQVVPVSGMQPVRGILRSAFKRWRITNGGVSEDLLSDSETLNRRGMSEEHNFLRSLKLRGILMFNKAYIWEV